MKVAICDDKVEIQGEVEKIVKDWYEHNCVWGQVYKCSNRKELLQDIFDLVFLDIELEKEDGIEVYVTYEVLEDIGTNEKIVF